MHLREWIVRAALAAPLAAGLATLAGCGQSTTRHQLGAANPLDRAQAIVQVYETHDIQAIQKLVDLLDDRDSAVRMYAILALRRLCGVDFGYRFYEDAAAREAAAERWREALRNGQVTLRPAAESAVSASSELQPNTFPDADDVANGAGESRSSPP
jgi:HEAT repeat protein